MPFVLYLYLMSSINLYLALAAFFGSTLTLILYYRESGSKLETRTSKIIKEKKQIITKSYLEVAEKICERFKTERTLSDELEEKFEDISYIRSRLNDFPNGLSKVVDKLTFSFAYGFASVVSIITFAYIPYINLDPTISFWSQIMVSIIMFISIYRYFFDGLVMVLSLRKFEKLVNAIDRSNRLDQLYELF